ncbi:PREDICTED: cytochrome P450 71A4-like [Fragaria vesca subsp. vesca]
MGRKYSTSAVGEGGNKIMFKELLWEFNELLSRLYIGDYITWLSWLSHVNGFEAKLDKVAKQFDDILDRVIQVRVDHRSKTSGSSGHANHVDPNKDNQMDFLDVLLEIQEGKCSGLPIDRVNIKAIILDMFGGGTDSTYSVLEWTMAELLRHPKVMNKLQSEVRGLAGNKENITEDDLIEMNYLKAVIRETLRLHPSFPILSRISNQDGNDFRLIPFGAGRRVCPGIQFAMAVNEIAIANLVHKFDWSLPGGASGDDLDMTETTGMPIHPKHPLKAVATPFLANRA